MRSLFSLFFATSLLLTSQPSLAAEVVTTLRPLKLIADALVLDQDRVHALLPASASPHDYQLRPSDLRHLSSADLILWVGPEMERFLSKPLRQLAEPTRLITLAPAATEPASPADDGHDDHAPPDHHQHADHHDSAHPAHDDGDLHLWLSPAEAAIIAEQLSQALSRLNPQQAVQYQHKLAQFQTQLAALDAQLAAALKPVSRRGYFVFHDAYGHFERHYGLNHLGAFTLSPERRIGARHLAEIRQQLTANQAFCVFSEPQFKPALIDAVTEDLPVRQGVLDPLGSSADSYPALLQQLTDSLVRCLTP